MNIKQENIEISKLTTNFEKKVYVPTAFQREADAWNKKTKRGLIQSVLDGFYIPPLLFSQNNILDGLQRINCLYEFINDKFDFIFKGEEKGKYFKDLSSEMKSKILNRSLLKINLTNDDDTPLSDEEQKELFYRINANSIKLNKAELIFTSCPIENREFITAITENNADLNNLAQNKKGKRFSLPHLLLWCLTAVYYRETGFFDSSSKASIRNCMDKFINLPFSEENRKEFETKSKKTIKLMNEIFDNTIVPSKFKVIFSALFVALYEHLDSHNSFSLKKDAIKKEMMPVFAKLVEDQQIGGIHYDSYAFFKGRVSEVMSVLNSYLVDEKRILSIKEKIKVFYENAVKNGGKIICCHCGKIIKSYKDINFDHIYAHTNGGKTDIDNSQILCEKCNKTLQAK